MGIHDRDYYRNEGTGFFDALWPRGQVCKAVIAINVVVFLLQMVTQVRPGSGPVTDALSLDTERLMNGEIWRLLTYSFLHSPSIWHILFNMLFLWWFGSDVETIYGPREFLAFYLTAAVLGGVAFCIVPLATDERAICVGASGAVTAVMVVCACHFPQRVILVFMVLPVPIWLFVVFQVAQDTFTLFGGQQTSTAVACHLGGALFGFLYYKFQWRILNLLPSFNAWRQQRARPRLRVFRGDDDEGGVAVAASGRDVDEQLEAKLDAVLEKVARTGQSSLTDSERQILLRASEIYKRRRH